MALFGYQNAVEADTTILTPSSAASGFSAENLRLPQGPASVAWQTAFGTTTATLLITASAAVAWRVSALARTNLTTSATMRVRCGAVATIISAPTYDSGVISAGVAVGVGQALHVMPAAVSAVAMQIDITDTANPDLLLNIPLCYAGPGVETSIALGSDFGIEPARDDVKTRGGVIFTTALSKTRGWSVKYDAIRDADLTWLDELEAASAQGLNILFVPRIGNARASSETIFGLLVSGRRGFITRNGNLRSWSASILERL